MADSRKQLRLEIEAIVQGARRVRDLANDVTDLDRKAKKGIPDPTGRMRAGIGRTVSAVASLKGALLALGAGVVLRNIAQAGLQMERLQRGLESVAGSTEAANREFEFIKRTSEELGLELSRAGGEYLKLSAAAKGTALEGEETRRIFEAVGTASLALGLSAEQSSGALTAFEQIISKGRVSAEELRQQLGERLPGAFRIAADSIGVTTAELDKMLEQGQLTAEELLPSLTRELQDRFGPAARAAAGSAQQEFAKFQNELFLLKSELAEELLPTLIEVTRTLREELGDPQTIEGLKNIISTFATLISWVTKASTAISQFVQDAAEDVARLQGFSGGLEDMRERLDEVNAAIERLNGQTLGRAGEANRVRLRELEREREALERQIRTLEDVTGARRDAARAGTSDDPQGGGVGIPGLGAGSGESGGTGDQKEVSPELKEAREQVERLREELEALQGASRDAGNEMSEFAVQASRNVQDAFGDFFFAPFEKGLDGLVVAFANAMRRMAAEALAANLLQNSGLGGFFNSLLGNSAPISANAAGTGSNPLVATVNHAGGMAGGGGVSRAVPAAAFAGAPRFHDGGVIPRIRPGEIPAILRSDEEVLTRGDPRHQANGGGVSGRVQVQLVNEGTAKEADREAEVQMNPEGMVIRIMLQDFKRGGPVSEGILNLTGRRRGGG